MNKIPSPRLQSQYTFSGIHYLEYSTRSDGPRIGDLSHGARSLQLVCSSPISPIRIRFRHWEGREISGLRRTASITRRQGIHGFHGAKEAHSTAVHMRISVFLRGYAALTSHTTRYSLGRRREPDGKVCVHILCDDMLANECFVLAKGISQRCIPEKIQTEFPAIATVSKKRYDDLSAADCALLLSMRCDLLRGALVPLVEQNLKLPREADHREPCSGPSQGRLNVVSISFCLKVLLQDNPAHLRFSHPASKSSASSVKASYRDMTHGSTFSLPISRLVEYAGTSGPLQLDTQLQPEPTNLELPREPDNREPCPGPSQGWFNVVCISFCLNVLLQDNPAHLMFSHPALKSSVSSIKASYRDMTLWLYCLLTNIPPCRVRRHLGASTAGYAAST